MSTILSDPEILKVIVFMLLAMVVILIVAVVYLAMRKSTVVYVEKEVPTTSSSKYEHTRVDYEPELPKQAASPMMDIDDDLPVEPQAKLTPLSVDDIALDDLPEASHSKIPSSIMLDDIPDESEDTAAIEPNDATLTVLPIHQKDLDLDLEEPASPSSVVTGISVSVTINGKTSTVKVHNFPCILGREASKCDIVLSEPAVSRRHAQLSLEDGDIYLEDISGHNGTFLNETKLPPMGKAKLHNGDIINLGRTVIRVNGFLYD